METRPSFHEHVDRFWGEYRWGELQTEQEIFGQRRWTGLEELEYFWVSWFDIFLDIRWFDGLLDVILWVNINILVFYSLAGIKHVDISLYIVKGQFKSVSECFSHIPFFREEFREEASSALGFSYPPDQSVSQLNIQFSFMFCYINIIQLKLIKHPLYQIV